MLKDYLLLHLIVFLWGFTAIVGVLLTMNAAEIVFYRTLLAGGGMWLLSQVLRIPLRIPLREALTLMAAGSLVSIHWMMFFGAARVATASVCLAGISTVTLFTAILNPWINRKPFQWHDLFFGVVIMAGLYIVFQFELGYWLGIALALGAALLAALFSVLNAKFSAKHTPFVITFYEMAGAWIASVIAAPVYAWTVGTSDPDPLDFVLVGYDWLYLLFLALVCTVFAFYVSVELLKRMSVFTINLTINLEPVYGIVLAYWLLGGKERMSAGFYGGTLVILVAVLSYPLVNQWIIRRRQR